MLTEIIEENIRKEKEKLFVGFADLNGKWEEDSLFKIMITVIIMYGVGIWIW